MFLRESSDEQQLRVRYLDQLKKQEDQIDASRAHIVDVKKDLADVQTKLEDAISKLAFGN